jgi:hypothetical protein
MSIEAQLRERLRKAEALQAGAATAGERDAAGTAIERLRARLNESSRADPAVEIKFTLPDPWSARLFIALCRRYGFEPYRYRGQRRTTLMVRAPRLAFDTIVWSQFQALHADLMQYLEDSTDRVIREAIYGDVSDARVAPDATRLA